LKKEIKMKLTKTKLKQIIKEELEKWGNRPWDEQKDELIPGLDTRSSLGSSGLNKALSSGEFDINPSAMAEMIDSIIKQVSQNKAATKEDVMNILAKQSKDLRALQDAEVAANRN